MSMITVFNYLTIYAIQSVLVISWNTVEVQHLTTQIHQYTLFLLCMQVKQIPHSDKDEIHSVESMTL